MLIQMILFKLYYYIKIFLVFKKALIRSYIFRVYNINKIKQLENKLLENKKYLAVLNTTSIGALSVQLDFFYKFSIANNLNINKSFYFLGSKKVCNKYFIKKISEIIKINYDDQLLDLLMIHGGLKKFIKKKICIKFENDFVNFMPNVHFPIKFTPQENKRGNKILKHIGIKGKKNIVGFSFKNNDYWQAKNIEKPWDSYRFSSFENLKATIEYLNERNFQPILLGNYSFAKEVKIDNFIIPNNLKKKDRDFFDIYIFTKMKFFISGALGLKFLADLFSLPTLVHNGFLPQWQSNGIFLPKRLLNKCNNEILPLDSLLKKKLLCLDIEEGRVSLILKESLVFRNIDEFNLRQIKVEENSSEEILSATKELIDYVLENKKLTTKQHTEQKLIKKIFFRNKVFSSFIVNYGINFGGLFSPSYIRKNKEYLQFFN